MRAIQLLLALVAMCALGAQAEDALKVYICECEEEFFLGEYGESAEMSAGAPIYKKANGAAVWKHHTRWYVGKMIDWPPESWFRAEAKEEDPDLLFQPYSGTLLPNKHLTTAAPITLAFSPCGGGEL
mmetsp:Transcript_31850/g.101335  ORF Transcript_31850/g.101335 Transcript_31850/m.101335 type:complete len:127 (-) Transcript_31850:1564-1944(-)|eukprot:CAMPEP_0118850298 /NCGR_PEP_ID=MMETSP1163-20130328/218_1 /TAXON_ID=124430 /ORGANISM="Phaeomonas parva, Strain CCMP2877" /LENGTH=126 /DNA_ID=CAMNT_0006782499 /DNA_START=493 /DNA_END=873 /DNA_ORIENTATION=+